MLILLSIFGSVVLLFIGYLYFVSNKTNKSCKTYDLINGNLKETIRQNRNMVKREVQVVYTCPKCNRSMYRFSTDTQITCKYCGK